MIAKTEYDLMTACFKRLIFPLHILKNILKYILHYLSVTMSYSAWHNSWLIMSYVLK